LAIIEPQTKVGTCTDEHIGSERVVVPPQQRIRWKYRRAATPENHRRVGQTSAPP
jgi:hypothetical protein